jgi:hypothetical protein
VTSALGRVLLDECVPRRFQRDLEGIDVSHVVSEGWAGRRNGELLRLMRERGFATLVTVDRNLAFQQNVAATGLAVVVMHAESNRVEDLRALVPALIDAIARTSAGEVTRVDA